MSRQRKRAAAAAALTLLIKIRKRKRLNKRMWVRKWISRRPALGAYSMLLSELRNEDPKQLKKFLRMSEQDFDFVLSKISDKIVKLDTNMRESIKPKERLALTLRFLATGDSYHFLMYLFRIPVCTISKIIPECCVAVTEALQENYFKVPTTEEEWLAHAKEFEEKWNFFHCVGALDGKHIVMQAPPGSGSYYYNYKRTHSVVLMALADAQYKITCAHIGCNGRVSDGGVFNACALSSALQENSLHLPLLRLLPGRTKDVPYVIVADDAFALKTYIMKPYPFRNQPGVNRVYNYRLSRARRIVENVFGIMTLRFRVLRKPIGLLPAKVRIIVKTICVLHNFLISRKASSHIYAPVGTFDSVNDNIFVPGSWRTEGLPLENMLPLQNENAHNYSATAKEVREEFRDYFVSPEGEVAWQYKHI